jgi:phosphatidate cytidylyltransferase
MALNFSTFRVRALSAVVFVAIMLGGMFWNDWSFFFLFAFIAVGCFFEYQKLLARVVPNYNNVSKIHKWGLLLLVFVVMMTLAKNNLGIKEISIKYIGSRMAIILIAAMVLGDIFTKKINLENWAISFFGLVYIPMSLSIFYQLKGFMFTATPFMPRFFDISIALLVIISIWINDTMAYVVGSIIGKKPLSSVSPNKTWEGTIAGIILSVLIVSNINNVMIYFGFGWWQIPIQQNYIFLISLVATVAGTFGDLFESSLKRQAGVKDSGSMMPGHGGFLDRFDSILLATPFVWLLLRIVFSPGN